MTAALWGTAISRRDGSAADGIHLVWTAPYAAGYSLDGFDIQRRETATEPRVDCYTLTAQDLNALHTDLHLLTRLGTVSLQVTPCPVAMKSPIDEPFAATPSDQLHRVEFGTLELSAGVDSVEGVTLRAFDAAGARQRIVHSTEASDAADRLRGVNCAYDLEIQLPTAASRVELTLVPGARPARVLARGADGSVVASAISASPPATPETIRLDGRRITRISIVSPANDTLLSRLTWQQDSQGVSDFEQMLATAGELVSKPSTTIVANASIQRCLLYDISLDGPHQIVSVTATVAWTLMLALREGKVVDSRFLTNSTAVQQARFAGRGVDEIRLYVNQRISALTFCVDLVQPQNQDLEWSNVPYLVKHLQLPLRSLEPTLGSPADELARATSRLIGNETLDAAAFESFAATMNETLSAGAPSSTSPLCFTRRTRERLQDPFVEVRPWPYALSLTTMAAWRRALGLGYLDTGGGLVPGRQYDYRITGRFRRSDIDVDQELLGFHTVPLGVTLPTTFHLDTVRVSASTPLSVELFPSVADTALHGTGRKGIRLKGKLTLGFDTAITRLALEFEPAAGGSISYSTRTSDFILGLSGSVFQGTIPVATRALLQFNEPIDTLELSGNALFYGLRVLTPTSGNPADVLEQSLVLPGVPFVSTDPPAPPQTLGTANLQQPILPGDPAVTTQNPPQSLGFVLRWVPPPPAAGTSPLWPPDLPSVPPVDVLGYRLERRRVDLGEPFKAIDGQPEPTLFFGNRGAAAQASPLGLGVDLLQVFPETVTPVAPVDPWISMQDVLRSAARSDGPPPGSLFQYRVFSIDVIGRQSPTAALGSVVRLEKRIAPPRPPGPVDSPLPGVVRPSGVRARVLQADDANMPTADVALLGASHNAIVLEWGWTDDERTRDPFATEFRVYFLQTPPDAVHGLLQAPATLVNGLYEMVCTLDQPIAADVMKGSYLAAGDYPFKVASNTAGTSITVRFEPSLLQPGTVPGAASFVFAPPLSGSELRPSAWQERTTVIPIAAHTPQPFVFRDRLNVDASQPRARAWVGVSSADAQSYIPDELPTAVLNGGRPGNESSIAAVAVEARFLGRPTFVVPTPLPDVPEDVSPEPVGATVDVPLDLVALLPSVSIPPGHLVVVERLAVSLLVAALSRRADGSLGVLFPDGSTGSYTLANRTDQRALLAQIATGEPARVENRFLMDLLLRFPAQFASNWQRATPMPVAFGAIVDVLPAKADRWLHRVRLVDPAGHVSEGAAIAPRVLRVASTRTPSPPELTVDNSETDTLSLSARIRQAFDVKWLVLFTLIEMLPTPLDQRTRDNPQLLRIPDRRDLYPKHGIRVRLADGTLLEPAEVIDVAAVGTEAIPDVLVPATIAPGFEKQVSVWAVTMTRDGMPSRITGPVTVHSGPRPLVVPGLIVTASAGADNATWAPLAELAEVSVQRSTDGGATFNQVSPWLPSSATGYSMPVSSPGARLYRLVLRGRNLDQRVAGPSVAPG